MKRKQYDIFISYRREGGEDKARILNQHLSAVGFNVFFDHEAGMRQEFETEILAAVEIAPVFIMLLTPYSLDRCANEGDWVRREIERAIAFGKEIIPVNPNYGFSFDGLEGELPESVMALSKIQFAEVDFHKNFKATANSMIEERIKQVVQPSIVTKEMGDIGARIHFFSDISCRVMHFGNQIAVTDAADTESGVSVRLLKGRHRLEYVSIEHEADAYKEELVVPDNDYEDFVEISLQQIKEERQKREDALKEEEERKAAEERRCLEWQRKNAEDGILQYKYDLFFCYSRQDASIVRYVYQFLSNAGYKCWMDLDGIASGTEYEEVIGQAIYDSHCFVFFNSEYSSQSKWAQWELHEALHKGKLIIPIKINDFPYSKHDELLLGCNISYKLDISRREDVNNLIDAFRDLLGYTSLFKRIDLGLSVYWAEHNVGASLPEEYGDYYAWGETEVKDKYTKENYKFYDVNKSVWIGIGEEISASRYDVAREKWGGKWRMPTYEEVKELIEKCEWKWCSQGNRSGYHVTGPNGNSIFLPAGGNCYVKAGYNDGCCGRDILGCYWTGKMDKDSAYFAHELIFSDSSYRLGCYDGRYYGLTVRPVTE